MRFNSEIYDNFRQNLESIFLEKHKMTDFF